MLATALLRAAEYTPIPNPQPILNDWPTGSRIGWSKYIRPIMPNDYARYQRSALVNAPNGDLAVRAWNYLPNVPGHNTPGIVESRNVLPAAETAIVAVHPWGIEDGQGWQGPQAYNLYGYAFCGLKADNDVANEQMREIFRPFIASLRGRVRLTGYSLPGVADAVRSRLYRDYSHRPNAANRPGAQRELTAYLRGLTGKQWPDKIPVNKNLERALDDVVFYDGLGYTAMRTFLMDQSVRNVLLIGYNTDMCVISTTAGYRNLTQDFNVFLVGDVTLAAWPVTVKTPNGYTPHATTTELITASQHRGKHPIAITQSSWIEPLERIPTHR
jgi:hypothetical protein